MPLNLREVEVFRPYSNEIPEDLLWAEGLQETEVARWLMHYFTFLKICPSAMEKTGRVWYTD